MNKQELERLHKQVCRGKVIPFDNYDEYKAYVETIAPPREAFKPVATGRATYPLDSGLLNELSAPAGVKYTKIANWWSMEKS